ncbi:hypothetical protein J2Y40_002285 [Chryseobacterium sp. 2987]|nr:hypothetical protein [Chryseobacterium sp. 2987]
MIGWISKESEYKNVILPEEVNRIYVGSISNAERKFTFIKQYRSREQALHSFHY